MASGVVICELVKKMYWMIAAMVLPPAPTKPETVPSERLEMNGTTP
jgi:hypothetical protein